MLGGWSDKSDWSDKSGWFNQPNCPIYPLRLLKKNPATMLDCGTSALWALTDSNRRPSACKADALNQLS